jgi:hypothetical protein
VGILAGATAVAVSGRLYFATNGNLWYTGAALLGGAVGTGAIVCAVGQSSPTRQGGCRASIVGALVGVVGLVPGLLILRQASAQCTATGPNADDQCAVGAAVGGLVGLSFAAVGYALGTAFGARAGWEMGATSRYLSPPLAANLPLFSLRF